MSEWILGFFCFLLVNNSRSMAYSLTLSWSVWVKLWWECVCFGADAGVCVWHKAHRQQDPVPLHQVGQLVQQLPATAAVHSLPGRAPPPRRLGRRHGLIHVLLCGWNTSLPHQHTHTPNQTARSVSGVLVVVSVQLLSFCSGVCVLMLCEGSASTYTQVSILFHWDCNWYKRCLQSKRGDVKLNKGWFIHNMDSNSLISIVLLFPVFLPGPPPPHHRFWSLLLGWTLETSFFCWTGAICCQWKSVEVTAFSHGRKPLAGPGWYLSRWAQSLVPGCIWYRALWQAEEEAKPGSPHSFHSLLFHSVPFLESRYSPGSVFWLCLLCPLILCSFITMWTQPLLAHKLELHPANKGFYLSSLAPSDRSRNQETWNKVAMWMEGGGLSRTLGKCLKPWYSLMSTGNQCT